MGKWNGLFLLAGMALGPLGAGAVDIVLIPPTGGGVSMTNATGATTFFRVAEDGTIALDGFRVVKGGKNYLHGAGSNTFMGQGSGNISMTGQMNTVVGEDAFVANSGGQENTGLGMSALAENVSGNYNTGVGTYSLRDNVSGTFNTGLGYSTLFQNAGTGNTALGFNAGRNLLSGDHNILVNNTGVAGDNGTIRLGSSLQTRAFVAGIRGVTTGSANAIPVVIDANGQLGTVSSSASTKDDIADMGGATADLMKLRPVTFHYLADQDPAGRTLQYGLVAEEVEQVYPGLVAHSADGKAETVMYQFLPPMLLNEFQKQQRTIDRLEAELGAIRRMLARGAPR